MGGDFVVAPKQIPVVRWYREGGLRRALVDILALHGPRLVDAWSIREAMRQAIRAFVATSDGRALLADIGVDPSAIAWGDVLGRVPNEIWRRFGLEHTGLRYQDGLLVPDGGPVFGRAGKRNGC